MEHEVKALGLQESNVKIRRQYRPVVAVNKKQKKKLQSSGDKLAVEHTWTFYYSYSIF
jgi:hypothetical protein